MIKSTTIIFIITALVLAVTHYLAIEFFLYWRYLWFDMVTHTLGGATVALGLFSLKDFWPKMPAFFLRLFPVVIFVFLVAIVWEVFEIWAGISMTEPNYLADTALDLVLGILGGAIGFVVARSIKTLDV